ncbi:MAG: hypothetical protein J7L96_11240, partial [Bacteroidales bacterium]|nr:hypothetical protein [Bacteroidales bacterium]
AMLYRITVFLVCIVAPLLTFFGCEPLNQPPVASFILSPNQGDSLTAFYFDARETYDPETPTFGVKIRWDWDGDSIFDTDYLPDKEFARRFTKPGWHHIIMEATDLDGLASFTSDSLLIFQGNGFVDSLTDPRDGQKYSIARINYQWVMTDNLRFGNRLDLNTLPQNNQMAEYYTYNNDPELTSYGGLYNWDEAMNYIKKAGSQGVCPPGWHVPTQSEWKNVLEIFPHRNADMFYYWGQESPTGFNLKLSGFMFYSIPPDSLLSWYPLNTVAWWTSDEPADYLEDHDDFIYSLRFFSSSWEMRRHIYEFDDIWDERTLLKFACYLRCFKNTD